MNLKACLGGAGRSWELPEKWGGLLMLAVLSGLVYGYFFLDRAYVEFECIADHPTSIQMIWANKGEKFSRANMGVGHLEQGWNRTGFFLGDLRKMHSIRFDPMDKIPGTVVFRKITIRQPGLKPLVLASQEDFKLFRPGKNLSRLAFADGEGWIVSSENGNPDLYMDSMPPPVRSLSNLPAELLRLLVFGLLLLLLLKAFEPLASDFGHVPALLLGVALLAATMAASTQNGSHPDETVHVSAAAYYEQHWLPPAADSPEIFHTYSHYGYSRLNTLEISYVLAGKFARLLDSFHLPSHQRHRLFNVLLLSILALLAFRSVPARLVLLPLLMTPQPWYVFSSFNSDAFALFATLLAAWQLADDESLLNRLLDGRARLWQAIPLLGLLTAALLLIKINFSFFLVFAALHLLATFVLRRRSRILPAVQRLLAAVAVGLALFAVCSLLSLQANGFDKSTKMREMREARADHAYKPSTEMAKKHPYLHMKERGATLADMFAKHRWGGKVIRSFYGVYGHMTVSGSTYYYELMIWSGFLFLAFLVLTILLRGGLEERILLVNTAACILALIASAFWNAWTMDFQAQGRHVLVVLPMLGVLVARTERLLPKLILHSFVALMCIMSLCSYIFVGLASPLL